ncbi:MAG: hypothetical protein ACKESB_00485 [Candidatus Hodgkinia cicadicola]
MCLFDSFVMRFWKNWLLKLSTHRLMRRERRGRRERKGEGVLGGSAINVVLGQERVNT